MINQPPYLKRGDTIGLVAPAGFMPVENMQACIETLDSWGYNLELGQTTHSSSSNYFSGTDEERMADLQHMLDHPDLQAIFCVRGGYGLSRIIDGLSFKKFEKHPKWIVGFSDVTVLHSHLYSNYKISSLHAPMAAAFGHGEQDNVYIQSLRKALEGEPALYSAATHHLNREGKAEGALIGGNLALLAHLIGTESDIKTKHRILFLEDVGEYLYNIDRLMVQLKRSGKLDKLEGLIIGGFTETKDTTRGFGMDVYDLIYHHVSEYGYPVCFGFPVSHAKENVALKIGVRYQLSVDDDGVSLTEST